MSSMRRIGLALPIVLAGCGGDANDKRREDGPAVALSDNATVPIRTGPAVAPPKPAAAAQKAPAGPPPAIRPAAEPDTGDSYRALGTEPFWAIRVTGRHAVLERPDHPPVRYAVRREGDDVTILYQGDGFSMRGSPGPCSDGMSDALWSDRVQVAFAGGTLKGCGGVREEPR